MDLSVVILAGGNSTRMKSVLPKWMLPISGKPMIEWILDTVHSLSPKNIYIIVSPKNQHYIEKYDIISVIQEKALGTGHAIRCFMDTISLPDEHCIMVLNGDVPFIRKDILIDMYHTFKKDSMILASLLDDPLGYGRIIMDNNEFKEIIEEKDLLDGGEYRLCNMGVYLFRYRSLQKGLEYMSCQNNANEYYITSVFKGDVQIYYLEPSLIKYFRGINTMDELNNLEIEMKNS